MAPMTGLGLSDSVVVKRTLTNSPPIQLSAVDAATIEALLARVPTDCLHLADLWTLMDQVWDEMGLDSRHPDPRKLSEYYAHPVWLLNGLYVESDPLSRSQRKSWTEWLRETSAGSTKRIRAADFGGGFGTLAALLAEIPGVDVDIVDPHAPESCRRRFQNVDNVRFRPHLGAGYDYVFCSDVLEHLEDPLSVLAELVAATRARGRLMIANNFFPVIKCHLPGTFHLRYSFRVVAQLLGLQDLGPLPCGHGREYVRRRERRPSRPALRMVEVVSRAAFPLLLLGERVHHRARSAWRAVR